MDSGWQERYDYDTLAGSTAAKQTCKHFFSHLAGLTRRKYQPSLQRLIHILLVPRTAHNADRLMPFMPEQQVAQFVRQDMPENYFICPQPAFYQIFTAIYINIGNCSKGTLFGKKSASQLS
jgi:hypothetical protein